MLTQVFSSTYFFICHIVDTPFFTGLKTQTPSFVHSVIVHVCTRFEFPEPSAERLVSGPLNFLLLAWFLDHALLPFPLVGHL